MTIKQCLCNALEKVQALLNGSLVCDPVLSTNGQQRQAELAQAYIREAIGMLDAKEKLASIAEENK